MSMTKLDAEHLFELSEPYTKEDLKRASRRAVKKWHPDAAARSGIDPSVAMKNYTQISEAERYLVGFFDGQPDGFRVSPTKTDAQTGSGTTAGNSRAEASSPDADGKKTRRPRGTTSNESSVPNSNQGSRRGTSSTSRGAGSSATSRGAGSGRKRNTTERDAYHEEKERRWDGTQEERRQPEDVSVESDDSPEENQQIVRGDVFRGLADNAQGVRKAILIASAALFLISVESAVRSFAIWQEDPLLVIMTMVMAAMFLAQGVAELRQSAISGLVCSLLYRLADELDNDNPLARLVVSLIRLSLQTIRIVFSAVGWVVDRLLK